MAKKLEQEMLGKAQQLPVQEQEKGRAVGGPFFADPPVSSYCKQDTLRLCRCRAADSLPAMAHEPCTLGFGAAFGVVADHRGCGQPISLTLHRPFEELPPHRHVNDYLCIVLRGAFAEVQGNRVRERLSGEFFNYDAGEPHYDRYGSRGGMTLAVHYNPGEPQSGGTEGLCAGFARIAAEELAFELASRSCDELAMAALSAEIMAGIRTSAAAVNVGGNWIDRVVGAISDEPRRRWALQELADIADRHPVRLAQAFRARTGTSLGSFQRLRRLTSLSLALRHGNTPLAALAAEFGYCDQSHMTSEFRSAFGTTPGRYRRGAH